MAIKVVILQLAAAVFLQICLSKIKYSHRNMLPILEKKVFQKLCNLSGPGRQLIMDLNSYNHHLFHITYRLVYPLPYEPPISADELVPPPPPLFGRCVVEVNELRRAYNWTKQRAQDFIILFREARTLHRTFIDCVAKIRRNKSCDPLKQVTTAEVFKVQTYKNWNPEVDYVWG